MTMPGLGQAPQVTPERFFRGLNAFQLTAALKAAVELDIFTAIAEGASTPAEIAKRCQVAERGARILCDYLVIHEFLVKRDGRYSCSPDSAAFLDRRSPMYLGSCADFLTSPSLTEPFRDLAAVVRKGGTTLGDHGTLVEENPAWVEFARPMAPLQILPSELLAGLLAGSSEKCKVLDVAAGHGLFGVALARHNPNAEIYAVDWPNVLEVARENAQKARVSSRLHFIPGDAFKVDLGRDYDIVLLTNFLHHFDPPTVEKFLRRVHAALKPGGRAITLDFVPNEDRVSPALPASFSMIMLGSTPSGDAYTFSEYQRMFGNAGFASSALRALPPTLQSVIVSSK